MNELKVFEYVMIGTNGFIFSIWVKTSWSNLFIKLIFLGLTVWSTKLALG